MNVNQALPRLIPFALLIGMAYGLKIKPDLLNVISPTVLSTAPYVICALGFGFSWFFRRANIALGFLLVGGSLFILREFAITPLILTGFSILLPLNILLLSLWVERGLLTTQGILKALFIASQILTLFVLGYAENGLYARTTLNWLTVSPLPLPFESPLAFLSLSLFALSGLWLMGKSLLQAHPVDMGWFSLLICLFISFLSPNDAKLFVVSATLCLLLGVIFDSYRMAFLDELTGLPARRALISDMKKLGSRYVIAMADIDHFKKFNDTYGHDVGDQVLKMVASNLDKVTGGGKAYRYGGEEFTILFPNRSIEHAMEHLEGVRARVENASFTLRSKDRPKKKPKTKSGGGTETVRVTASFGVAEKSKNNSAPMAVMKAADEALYRAKKAGRNQVSK